MLKRSLNTVASWFRFTRKGQIAELHRLKQLVSQTALFDEQWYLHRYPDVAKAGQDPIYHFILHGGAEGRNPGPHFDARWYLRRNVDVARSGANPLVHYLEHGRNEGRSIKPLQPGRNDDVDLGQGDMGKPSPPTEVADPYANDYDASWQAQALGWQQLGAQVTSSEPLTNIEPVLLAKLAKGSDQSRIKMFLATVPGARQTTIAKWQTPDPVLLGLELLVDGWFVHARQLLLRIDGEVSGAHRIVAFQSDSSGGTCRVADQVAASSANLVRLSLENPFSPVLLAWLASDGKVVRTALAMFPSLYRGGLHHAEMHAVSLQGQKSDAMACYNAELAAALFGTQPLLLGRIKVDLRGASGSEHIFDPAVVIALGMHFGTQLLADGEVTGSAMVADRLGVTSLDPALSARRRGGAALVIPADCLPSLASLCGAFDNNQVGAATFCIVPGRNIAEAVLACLPFTTDAMHELTHPALPLPQPRWEPGSRSQSPAQQVGLPSAIRTFDEIVWQVDALMPLSPDLELPVQTKQIRPPKLQVIVTHSGTQGQLDLCLLAISTQLGVAIDGVTVISTQSDITWPVEVEFPIAFRTPAGDTETEAISPAQDDVLVKLDTAVFPHDPRTFAALANLCRTNEIGAASCAIGISCSEEGVKEVMQAPWVLDCTFDPPGPADEAIARFFPAATFAVAAVDPRIMALRADLWREFKTADQVNQPADVATKLASLCRDRGLQTVFTTIVRAAAVSLDPFTEVSPASLDAFKAGRARDSATYLIRLLP